MQKSGNVSDMHRKYVKDEEALGKGAFGVVYRAENRTTHEEFAIKEVKINAMGVVNYRKLMTEIAVLRELKMSDLDMRNIIQFVEFYEDKKQVCIVTEFANGGTLYEV